MVDLEHDAGNGVLVRRDLVFAVASTLSAERSDVLKVHGAISSIDFNEGAFVAHLRIGNE